MKSIEFTHRNLCLFAAKYLRNKGIQPFHRCQYVVCELERVGESPDAFGWGGGTTQLIEVKVSRNDFNADKKKYWRQNPTMGLGKYRSYLCPEGMITKEDLPDKWGMLWISSNGKIVKVVEPEEQPSAHGHEINLITSILRREGIHAGIFSYKNYAGERDAMMHDSISRCKCKSYNRPDLGGDEDSVILDVPEKFGTEKKQISIDPCIADTIRLLWDNDVWTESSCCGHNLCFGNPSIVLSSKNDVDKAKRLIESKAVDRRAYDIFVWELVKA